MCHSNTIIGGAKVFPKVIFIRATYVRMTWGLGQMVEPTAQTWKLRSLGLWAPGGMVSSFVLFGCCLFCRGWEWWPEMHRDLRINPGSCLSSHLEEEEQPVSISPKTKPVLWKQVCHSGYGDRGGEAVSPQGAGGQHGPSRDTAPMTQPAGVGGQW